MDSPPCTRIAVFRALEQGTSLVRPTMNGLSLATDYRGRVTVRPGKFSS